MKTRATIITLAIASLLVFAAASQAALYDVYAKDNSAGSGGTGLKTISLSAGQAFTVWVDPLDLWSSGPLPRWSNADGLTKMLYATGSDESGEPSGTVIGKDWGLLFQYGFSAPYGALVGKIDTTWLLIGTNYSGTAPAAGKLYLYYWDSNFQDNSQFVTANVNVVPLPAAAWLLGGGVMCLAAIRIKTRK